MTTPRWLELVQQFDAENLRDLPNTAELISDNGISQVWRGNDRDKFIYKRQIPFLTENELHWLNLMGRTWGKRENAFTPYAKRFDKYTIFMYDLGQSEPVFDIPLFMSYKKQILRRLNNRRVHHGDITVPNVIVKNNVPYILDWAEARAYSDPRPLKRPEGDKYWIDRTWDELCEKS